MRLLALLLGGLVILASTATATAEVVEYEGGGGKPVTIVMRDVELAEAFEMLARRERVSILLGDGIEGKVSVSLFDVSIDEAVRSIAEAAGYAAERRRAAYVILEHDDVGQASASGNTIVRSFKIQYSDPKVVSDILTKHLSRFGEVTVFPDRRLVVVEDLPDFVARVETLLAEIDAQPRQILLETKILEISLGAEDTFGIDWKKLFTYDDGSGTFGVRGQTNPTTPGLFFEVVTPNVEAALNALSEKGRVRTLSTPSLLALEYEDAEVIIGDRLGYRVTTTINEVTTESVEFLESGVILRFVASVDRSGRILLGIHPEVSTGVINDGLPEQTTAEVTTRLLVDEGEKVFIGGLIKDRVTQNRSGVPILGDLPWLGRLFSETKDITATTETVVVVTAYVLEDARRSRSAPKMERIPRDEATLAAERERLERIFREITAPLPPAATGP